MADSGTYPPTSTNSERGGEEQGAMSGSEKVVCVTGASGFIASWIVKLLLDCGYTVRATVRDPSDPKKVKHLRELDRATERLHLFKADLLGEGSFDAAIDGCDGVFHAASPVTSTVANPQADLIDPAVKGTLNILRSCARAGTVRRVIVTSSMAAVLYNGKPRTPDAIFDETCFSIPDICEQSKSWYALSKTLAEEAAWKFSKEIGIDMVALNPGMVIGPLLQPTLNASCADILNLVNGSPTFPNLSLSWIHVKDVATAHILAFEVPSARGRYCLVERVLHYSELVAIIRDLYPGLQHPNKCADDEPYRASYNLRSVKAKELGLSELIPIESSLRDTIESLREKGFIISF